MFFFSLNIVAVSGGIIFSSFKSLMFDGIGSTTCSETYGLQKIGMHCRDEKGN